MCLETVCHSHTRKPTQRWEGPANPPGHTARGWLTRCGAKKATPRSTHSRIPRVGIQGKDTGQRAVTSRGWAVEGTGHASQGLGTFPVLVTRVQASEGRHSSVLLKQCVILHARCIFVRRRGARRVTHVNQQDRLTDSDPQAREAEPGGGASWRKAPGRAAAAAAFCRELWVQRELTVGQSPGADGTPEPQGPWVYGDPRLSRPGLFTVLSMRWLTHASPQSWEMGLMLAVPPTAQGGGVSSKCTPFSAGDDEAGFETTRQGPGVLRLIGKALSPLSAQAPVDSLLPLVYTEFSRAGAQLCKPLALRA